MKKLMILATLLLTIGITSACADNDRPVEPTQLPEAAQQFIKTHFPNETITFSTVDKEVFETTYEVLLSNGTKIDFNKKGEWKDVDCGQSAVPASIIPEAITAQVTQSYPNAFIVQIDRDSRDYEVELSNGLDLVFDLNFKLIRIDN